MPRSPEPSRPRTRSRASRPAGPARPVSLPRLRPVPPADPPYDDERDPGYAPPPPAQAALALTYDPPWEAAAAAGHASPVPAAAGHASPEPASAEPVSGAALQGYETRRVAAPPPDVRRLRAIGQAMAEILAGRRPPGTVADRLTDKAYADLVRAGTMIRTRRPPLVALPHVKQPHGGAVEACLLVRCGERSHVLALRLERRGVQWLVTDFETA
ncbi:Rv3235 family protein [Sphaerisporangium dianthi]|uniref:Rv3235 family protein n=1 Tax=Sphaerisporangium dianthi TaxID=1436120 RepID=A0ABV9CEM9_9ACTN